MENLPIENINAKIYEIRARKVMLDSDLAKLYQVETKVLNQAVKRNIEKFPSDFMFELSSNEEKSLRSQTVTLNDDNKNHKEENIENIHPKYLLSKESICWQQY